MLKIGLKRAARDLLRWNLKGQLRGIPTRGTYLAHRDTFFRSSYGGIRYKDYSQHGKLRAGTKKDCYACKIGLVMLGRYGDAAFDSTRTQNDRKLSIIKHYGPRVDCPAGGRCGYCWPYGPESLPLGSMIDHLFEYHLWGVVRIDKWLAELAKVDFDEEKAKVNA